MGRLRLNFRTYLIISMPGYLVKFPAPGRRQVRLGRRRVLQTCAAYLWLVGVRIAVVFVAEPDSD